MIFRLFNRKKQDSNPRLFLSLDIGTELLKGILFEMGNVGINALKHVYLRQPLKAMRSGVILDQDLVVHGVHTILEHLLKDMDFKYYPTMLGIAGELINGISIEVEYNRKHSDRIIDEAEEISILEYVYNTLLAQGKQELAKRLGTIQENVVLLHIGVVGLTIDNLAVKWLRGNKGKHVKMFVYSSFAPKDYIVTIKQIMRSVGLRPEGIVAQPYAVARAFKGSQDIGFNAIFVDIGGGTTDIAIVRQGFALTTHMYAFGGRVFTKAIAKNLGVSMPVAEEIKLKYTANQLDTTMLIKVREAIADEVNLWLESFKTALEELQSDSSFPTTIYLCGGGAMLTDLVDGLINYNWMSALNFKKHPQIKVIDPSMLEGVFLQDSELRRAYDVTPTALGRVYYDIVKYPKYNYVTKLE